MTDHPQGPSNSGAPTELPPGVVHTWFASFDPALLRAYRTSGLTSEDFERASRFRFERDRVRWLHARLVVRDVLARYLRVPTPDIHFEIDESGKPRLHPERHPGGLYHNLSHAGDYTLVAVCLGAEIGADIEWIDRQTDVDAIARRFFTAVEQDQLVALPEPLRRKAFFECWTRKEAFLKAKGTGLRLPLTGFDVAFGPGRPPEVLATRWDPSDAARWRLFAVEPMDGVVGAVAVAGSDWHLQQVPWNGPARPTEQR